MNRSFFCPPMGGPLLGYAMTGQGPITVFQHGLGADAAQPQEVFPTNVWGSLLTLECRGHAQSELGLPEDVSIATFAGDLARLLDHLRIERCIVGGISLGAAVALRFAATHPQRVAALILARPAWLIAAAPQNLAVFGEIARLINAYGRSSGLERFEQSSTLAQIRAVSPDNAASLIGQFNAPDPATRAVLLERISIDSPNVSEAELSRLSVPTLVIGNEMDAIHPISYAERLTTLIPKARFAHITPKSVSRDRYVADFRIALSDFIGRLQ